MNRKLPCFIAALALVAGLGACSDEPTAPTTGAADAARVSTDPAPLYSVSPGAQAVPDQYIVVYRDDVDRAMGLTNRLMQAHGGEVKHQYSHVVKGFAAKLPEAAVQALRRNPNVAYIEQDQVVTVTETQTGATWGLDRVDQRNRPLDGTYTYGYAASGVNAYIIDTGIRTSHNDFGGRAVEGYTAINDGRGAQDCNGHGTHVAGTVGGQTYGVAKGVRLYAVRVLDCNGSGTNSGVIAGMDWTVSHHQAGTPAVANMSLGGGASTTTDDAVRRMYNDGITVVVAAGNENQNACNVSPARAPEAVTVASSTSSDARSSFSNYGSCVDIFAPGSDITSAWYTSNSATNTISGTSMASPHVAGGAALYLAANPSASPATVTQGLESSATQGQISNVAGSPNLLLYTRFGGGGDPAPCSSCSEFGGSLSGSGDYSIEPNGTYYSSGTGYQRAWLRGPSGTDFDLYLYRWNGSSWSRVARSISSSSEEYIEYYGYSGYYYWEVVSYSGSGSYSLWIQTP